MPEISVDDLKSAQLILALARTNRNCGSDDCYSNSR